MTHLLKLNHLFLATWLFLLHSTVTHAAESNMSLENATWEVFSSQGMVQLLALSGRNEDFLLDTATRLFFQGVSLNNAQWKLFSSQGTMVQSLVLVEDNKTFLGTTTKGLAQFDITTGEPRPLLTTKDGLPDNGITRLLKEGSNGVWVGTANGLAYLDLDKLNSEEDSITSYTTENSELPLSDVFSIDSDGKGGIWIQIGANPADMEKIDLGEKPSFIKDKDGKSTAALTHRSRDGKWTTVPISPPGSFYWELVNDGTGGVWVLAYVDGNTIAELRHLTDNGEITYTTKDFGEAGNFYPFKLLSDDQGGIWAGMQGHLVHVDLAGTPKVYSVTDAGLPENSWVYPSSLNKDGIRVELDSEPIRFFDLSENGTWTAAGRLEFSPLWSSKDGTGGTWAIANDKRLWHQDVDGTWTSYPENDNYPDDSRLFDGIPDSRGGVWIGTVGRLIHLHNDGGWSLTSTNSLISIDTLFSIGNDGVGGKWVFGTRLESRFADLKLPMGVTFSNNFTKLLHCKEEMRECQDVEVPEFLKEVDYNNQLSPLKQSRLLMGKNGGLWLSTTTDGIYYTDDDGNNWKQYKGELPTSEVHDIIDDGNEGLWVGTKDGLAHFSRDQKWTIYTTGNSKLSNDDIQALAIDDAGGLWIGTANGGAYLNARQEWTVYTTDNSPLPTNNISALLKEKGTLWVGTYNETAKEGQITYFGEEPAEYNVAGRAQDFVSDGHGGLWANILNHGLAHISSQGERLDFTSSNSGLPSNLITDLSSDGQEGLWVATEYNGLAHLTFGNVDKLLKDITDPNTIKTILSDKHAAILIAAKSAKGSKDSIWETTKAVANHIYKMLYDRGFLHEQIYYLSPEDQTDFNGDDNLDNIIDAPHRSLTVSDVEEAFRWATRRGKLDQPLYFFFMDHGNSTGKLTLSQEDSLEGTHLKELLKQYQDDTGNEVILVIDACYSGLLLDGLIDPGYKRAIISSTSDGLSYPFNGQSFSYYLADGLHDDNFLGAYQRALPELKKLVGNAQLFEQVIKKHTIEDEEITQTPRFEDGSQGQWLKTVSINGDFGVKGSISVLAVQELTASTTTISANESLPLKVVANFDPNRPEETAERVTRVWAVVRPPKMALVIGVNGTPIVDFDYVPLSRNPTVKNHWQASWNKGIYNGDYEITFYAKDDKDNIASSNSIIVTVQNGTDPPPQANVQIQVEKESYRRGEIFNATMVQQLGWGYDLYVAVTLPEGKGAVLLNNTNKFVQTSSTIPWELRARPENQTIPVIKDFELPMDLSTGEYCLLAILSPQDEDVFETLERGLWVFGQECIKIQ